MQQHTYQYRPLTRDRWHDLVALFGERGACGGCWCMWFRLPRREYEAGKGARNRQRLKRIVEQDPPGILAYTDARAVGWCAVAPRVAYRRLRTARTMRPPDDLPVWSILCLYVDKAHRRRGLSTGLIRAAAAFAIENGAPAVEAYPVRPRTREVPPVFASQGIVTAFLQAGFHEIARPSPSRAVVRYRP
ncbi:MAG: GNAT family N-acetyltransferase [Gemmatimonadales bacterium]